MTARCRELEVSLSLRAVGALDGPDAEELEAHLAACPACRAEAARTAELLDLARVPPPGAQERRVLADLPARVVAAARRAPAPPRAPTGLRVGRRLGVGLIAAAAVAAVAIAPAVIQRRGPASRPAGAVTAVAAGAGEARATWQEPDLDVLWQDTEILSLDAASDGVVTEAAWTALDEGEGF